MTLRERILAVYRDETPDIIPYMLDLSHWFYHKNKLEWDLSKSYYEPDRELIDFHKKMDVGFYIPNLASFFSVEHRSDIQIETEKSIHNGVMQIKWKYNTPIGNIERSRIWSDITYSWGIKEWGIKTERDLEIFAYAMTSRKFTSHWEKYKAWVDYVGDIGVVYLPIGYSAMGYLLNFWMGIESVIYAVMDWPNLMHNVVDAVNQNILECIDIAAKSPSEIIVMGDNFSSDIQSPGFFKEWSENFYKEAIKRLHNAGKYVAVQIDGKLKGSISMIRNAGADCSDAITPLPMGDLTPMQCKEEAGKNFILSGGVSPDLWLPNTPLEDFKRAVMDWLELKKYNQKIIANAGDQVLPGADEDRIKIMRDLVEQYGRY